MNIQYGLFDSAYKHVKYERVNDETFKKKNMTLTTAKGQKFAFQLMINSDEEFFCSLDDNNNISWKGLENRVRLKLQCNYELIEDAKIYFEGYVKDDTGIVVADPILRKPGQLIEANISQMLWIEGYVPSNFNKENFKLMIDMYSQRGYNSEKKLETVCVDVKVMDVTIKPLKECEFFLDLWQHPSNWARMYEVPLWSEQHWEIIRNYLKELATLGQKVITAIVSDFSWGGQACYKVFNNPSNLFEHNMVKLKKSKSGEIICDFSVLDKYIEICMELGIDKEIDLFGLLGNWDARGFGNPLKDYNDPIRLNYYDEESETFKYIEEKKNLKEYLSVLFRHFVEKGWWNKVRVMSDEPGSPEIFRECVEFLSSAIPDYEIKYKAAVHNQNFLDNYKEEINDESLSLSLVINNFQNNDELKNKINNKNGFLTWYVCCFPDILNNFISSPLIESRLVGWFTYYFGLDGFLRWDYAIWPRNPFEEISYKFPDWKAGDMFFVYPGKDMKPISSLRWENLRFGIQDYQLFKVLENSGYTQDEINKDILQPMLGNKEQMNAPSFREVHMNYSLASQEYEKLRNSIIKKILK